MTLILFNKPFGVLSQFTDKSTAGSERPTLSAYIDVPAVYPAGRLDKDSEGLLVLTDDGQLQARISSPKFKTEKTYYVQVEGVPDDAALQLLRRGGGAERRAHETGEGRSYRCAGQALAARPSDPGAQICAGQLDHAHPFRRPQPSGPPDDSRDWLSDFAPHSLPHRRLDA